MKKILTMFVKSILILFVLIVAAIIITMILKGRGKPISLKDSEGKKIEGGIATRERIFINGKEQWIFLTGEKKDAPVLLFLHGGPGSPEVGMMNYEAGNRLEERFIVCHWEQRGSGLSYGARLKPEEMNIDLIVEDTLELSEYLQKRFGQDKIYLMGHSWGTLLGVKAITEKPKYYKAYFGIGQIAHQIESEKRAFDYMKNRALKENDTNAIKLFNTFDRNDSDFPSNAYMMSARTNYMNKYGIGIIHEENFNMNDLIKQVFLFEGYSFADFIKFGLGSMFNLTTLFNEVLPINFMETHKKFDLPFYILHGKYDMQVSYDLAKEYFDLIEAPKKEFFTFENSAHSPIIEEIPLFLERVFTILDEIETEKK